MSADEKSLMDEDEADIINKRFMEPESTLEIVETEMNLDLLAKNIKMEADDSYENGDTKYEIPDDFMKSPDENDLILDEEIEDILKSEDSLIQLHMDIRQPLITLKHLLQRRFGKSFNDFGFTLQGTLALEEEKNLVDQCVQGEGMVQVHIELKIGASKRNINIVDVLKPAEEYVEIGRPHETEEEEDDDIHNSANSDMVRWVVDMSFKKDLEKLKIPEDPSEWSTAHVRHWLLWAVRQFNLTGIKLSDWEMTGAQLSQMPHSVFKAKVPQDTDNSFWTHLELLRKCKIVAIRPKESDIKEEVMEDEEDMIEREDGKADSGDGGTGKSEVLGKLRPMDRMLRVSKASPETYNRVEFKYNFSGQVQLWQFLLELLTDKEHRNAIQWLDNEGEFKLVDPELVAHLWGARKNKPSMNYEKLSRALRYYYDGDMISKVQGKRFVYKFVCDLKQMVGYSASELNALVIEAELKSKTSAVSDDGSLLPIFSNDFITLLP